MYHYKFIYKEYPASHGAVHDAIKLPYFFPVPGPALIIILEEQHKISSWGEIDQRLIDYTYSLEVNERIYPLNRVILRTSYNGFGSDGDLNIADDLLKSSHLMSSKQSMLISKMCRDEETLRNHPHAYIIGGSALTTATTITTGLNCKQCQGFYPYAESSSPQDFTCTSCNSYREMVMG